jgi:regulator of replication initiation timing
MKMRLIILSAAAGCAMGLLLPPRAAAAVSDDDFNALKNQVQQLNDQVQELKREHQQDGITHNEDQMKIQQMQQQLGETQVLATNAVQKAEAAARLQPTKPVAGGMSALHNFSMVGDAEVQFGKTEGSHSGFMLADFAPIFCSRRGST